MSLDLDVQNNNIRNCVIKMLSEQYPLSAKEIFEIIILNQRNVSYPAVYKTLKMLTRERKLIKHNRKFSLNINWIKDLRTFSENVERSYLSGSNILLSLDKFTEENETKTFSFRNFAEADEYRKRLQMEYINSKRLYPYCAMYMNLKSPIIHSEKSLNILSTLAEQKIHSYLAVSSDSPIDRWCAKFYTRNPMVFVKTGLIIPSVELCETMILGDVIVQMYIPQNIQNYIDYLYKKTKNIENINAFEFYEKVYKSPSKTKIVVLKNKQIAEHMREQILSYFKKVKKK